LTATVAGLLAIVALVVGIVLGTNMNRSPGNSQNSMPPAPSQSPAGSASPSPKESPAAAEARAREAERRRAERAAQLDRSTYETVGLREFALMVKNPDAWNGRKIIVHGVVTQFDAATGISAFRADTGPAPLSDPYDYDQNTYIVARDPSVLADVVEKDMVTMYVEVEGAYTYDTQIGGSATVPAMSVNIIEMTNLRGPGQTPPSVQTIAPFPSAVPYPSRVPSDIESASSGQLWAIANTDRPFVTAQLADRWVPQLSSKRPGLVAEGRTWNNAMTLGEHQQLRLRYPDVRLLWSGDWSTFSDSNFWVTIVGITFSDSAGALAWCTSQGLDRDHCYAKLVSTSHPVEGSTAYNK
jgi:hypothetical protein